MIIKVFLALTIFCIAYPSIMIPIMGEKFSPFIAYYMAIGVLLIGTIGTWIGFVSVKQNDTENN